MAKGGLAHNQISIIVDRNILSLSDVDLLKLLVLVEVESVGEEVLLQLLGIVSSENLRLVDVDQMGKIDTVLVVFVFPEPVVFSPGSLGFELAGQ